MAIAATAWIGRDLTQLAAQPVVFGLAYLAFALAVAVRFGAIPFHLWAARLTDAAPETALPIITVLAPASLAIVGLAWTDASIAPLLVDLEAERMVVLAVAIASIVLAALAALVQDDLEHVVGYSIVGDAGVVLLAMAVLEPAGWAPARIWILVFIVTRSAFAAWAGGIRAVFRSGRIDDLRGWVIRSPILAVAFALVVAAGVGLPGLVAFEARASLVSLALDGPIATLVLIGTFAPLAYYGRLLAVGLGRPARPLDPATDWRPASGTARPHLAGRLDPDDLGPQPRVQRRGHRRAARRCSRWRPRWGRSAGRRPRPDCRPSSRAHPSRSRLLRPNPGEPSFQPIPTRIGVHGVSVCRVRRRLTIRPGRAPSDRSSRSYSCSSPGANQRASSVSAASGPSDACTMFWAVSRAKSPRIVPGAASCGRVAPLMARTTEIAFGPSKAAATSGAEVMNSTRPGKNGLPRWAA